MFCHLLLSTSAPRVFSVYIMQIGKRPGCFSSVCVFGGGGDGGCFGFCFLWHRIAKAEEDYLGNKLLLFYSYF